MSDLPVSPAEPLSREMPVSIAFLYTSSKVPKYRSPPPSFRFLSHISLREMLHF
jgi:hypothetical protein